MRSAVSFELLGSHPKDIRPVLEGALQQLEGRCGGCLLFLCGSISKQIVDVAVEVRNLGLEASTLIASGAGIMTERGEHEHMSGCVGLLWRSGSSTGFVVDVEGDGPLADRISDAARSAMGPTSGAVAMFASRDVVSPLSLFDTDSAFGAAVFGGGSLGRPAGALVQHGEVLVGDVVGLAIRGAGRPVVRASPACALLGPLRKVTAVDGALLLTIDDRPAIEVLREQAADVAGQRPVVVAMRIGDGKDSGPQMMVRGIRGVHEGRGGVMVSEDVRLGASVCFAALDAGAARVDLESSLRQMARDARGGIPLFGVYVSCAGRGGQLYGEGGVDLQMIRRQFPGLPMAGISTAFEIGPGPGPAGAAVHLYAGVFTLFYAPS